MVKASDVEADIKSALRLYGFTQALDPEFAAWTEKAAKSIASSKLAASTVMPDGHTLAQQRATTLRAQVKAACARHHGVIQWQTKK